MTPLIDMTFLLITFFIMSIHMGQAGEKEINLPNADQAKETTGNETELITVNVTPAGDFVVNGTHHEPGDLYRLLDERKRNSKQKVEMVVRGDREASFEKIQRVMRIAAQASVKDISLAALQTADDAGGAQAPAQVPAEAAK